MVEFTLGITVALIAGALVWSFVTLYKLKKKFKWMTDTWKDIAADQSRFYDNYYRNREDDQNSMSHRLENFERYFGETYVKKEEVKSKKLLKG